MIFGVIGAMEEEIRVLKERLVGRKDHKIRSYEMFEGNLGDHQVVLVQSGIGKVNATISTVLLLEHFDIDVVINTGSAGALDPGLKVGDLVLAYSLAYHDVDVTAFNYEYGQMAGMPTLFYPNAELVRIAQEESRLLGVEPVIGQIISGDQFIHSQEARNKILEKFPNARACEMESTAIAHTCYAFDIPYVIIRAISDNADGDASITFDAFILEAGKLAAKLVENVIQSNKWNIN